MDVNKAKMKNRAQSSKRVTTGTPKKKQLEAPVHTSLPPLVTGPLRGHVKVSLERGIQWEYSIGPPAPKLCVRLKWWGENSCGTIFRVPVHRCSSNNKAVGDGTTLAMYQIRSGWPQFKSYIQDMRSLYVHVGLGHMTDESMVIGQAAVPSLSKLSPTNPLTLQSPIVNPKGLCLGKLTINISIQPVEIVTALKKSSKVEDGPPEFIVGPSVGKLRGGSPENKNIATRRNTEEQVPLTHTEDNLSKSPVQDSPIEDEADRSDVSIGPQQMEVISELIDRGNALRDEMVRSLADGVSKRQHCPSPVLDHGEEATLHPLLLTGLSSGPTADLLPSSDNLHELVCLGMSSEEDEDDIVAGLDDISVVEPDYPLHNQHLLARLLYENDNEDLPISAHSSHKPVENEHQNDIGLSNRNVECLAAEQNLPSRISPDSEAPTQEVTASKLTSKLATKDPLSAGSSLTAFSCYLGSGERSLEGSIVRSLGLEKLTNLGRVSRARVAVESLEVEPGLLHKVLKERGSKGTGKKSLIPLSQSSSSCSTYFVEYQFPAAFNGVTGTHSSTRLPATHEVMRVASKKTVDNAVSFNHQSMFPVSFNSSVIQRWWNSTLIFRVYCKRLSERMPFLVGKAVVPLRSCLSSPTLDLHTRLEVRSSTLTDAMKSHVTDEDPRLGYLQVLIQLVTSDKKAAKAPPLTTIKPNPSVPSEENDTPSRNGPAVKFQEPKLLAQMINPSPSPLQLLLMIPEATNISLSHKEQREGPAPGRLVPPQIGVPNSYIVCRLFCAKPHPRTVVQWATPNPQFGFKQVHPLYLTPALMEQVCSNFTVIEVWHRTPGSTTDDELVGLVKVSLHQFYLAYSDVNAQHLYKEAKLPVVAMDSYCPIVNPFCGNVNGHLAVLCALGTCDQIQLLQQQFAYGSYSLHKPHVHSSYQLNNQPSTDVLVLPGNLVNTLAHVFEVTVEGVSDLTAFNNTVWGETDCFVQYHFPSQLPPQDDPDSVTLLLQPYRTGTTLCVPNPSFTHSTQHTLTLAVTAPIQQELVHMCGQGRGGSGHGLSGGVPFELWRRFYYPNIRDQLIAKTVLPIVKLCAMVSMGKGPNMQTFSLPLRLVAEIDTQPKAEGGVLDVTIRYKIVSSNKQSGKSPDVNIQQEGVVPSEVEEKDDKSESGDDSESSSLSSTEPPASPDCQQQKNSPLTIEEASPVPEDVFEARIVVHSALHLQMERAVPPSVYVTLHPHPNVDKVSTSAVSNEQNMIWDHHCVTYIPNMYLQPQCPGLEFQVWNKFLDSSPPHQSGPRDDYCIGCVYMDLSPLAFGLRQISGWYNIVDFGGQVKGQLKVTVSPTSRISYPSRLLSYRVESPPESYIGKTSQLERQGPSRSLYNEQKAGVPQSEPSESRTTSMLHEQLRDNIKELDKIHKSLQAKLGEIENSPPFSQAHILSSIPRQQIHSCSRQTGITDTEHTSTEYIAVPEATISEQKTAEHETFVSTTTQTEGIYNSPFHPATLPSIATPSTSPVIAQSPTPTHNETTDNTMTTSPPHSYAPSDLSPQHEESSDIPYCQYYKADRLTPYSDCTQENLAATEERSCSLTDVSLTSENTEVSRHSVLNSSTEQFEDDSEQSKHSEPLNSCPRPSSTDMSHIVVVQPSDLDSSVQDDNQTHDHHPPYTTEIPDHISDQMQADTISTVSHQLTPVNIPTYTATITQPLSEIQQPTTVKPPLSKPEPRHSRFGQLPNFFMPPGELEESMRRLRTSALSRPTPRTRPQKDTQTTRSSGGVQTVSTLQEVQQYLDSRKVQRLSNGTKQLDITSNETQRIARIFSSR